MILPRILKDIPAIYLVWVHHTSRNNMALTNEYVVLIKKNHFRTSALEFEGLNFPDEHLTFWFTYRSSYLLRVNVYGGTHSSSYLQGSTGEMISELVPVIVMMSDCSRVRTSSVHKMKVFVYTAQHFRMPHMVTNYEHVPGIPRVCSSYQWSG